MLPGINSNGSALEATMNIHLRIRETQTMVQHEKGCGIVWIDPIFE